MAAAVGTQVVGSHGRQGQDPHRLRWRRSVAIQLCAFSSCVYPEGRMQYHSILRLKEPNMRLCLTFSVLHEMLCWLLSWKNILPEASSPHGPPEQKKGTLFSLELWQKTLGNE
eukprot:s2288_g5.t6